MPRANGNGIRLGLGNPNHNERIAVSWYIVFVGKDNGSRSVSDARFFVDAKHLVYADDESGAYHSRSRVRVRLVRISSL